MKLTPTMFAHVDNRKSSTEQSDVSLWEFERSDETSVKTILYVALIFL